MFNALPNEQNGLSELSDDELTGKPTE